MRVNLDACIQCGLCVRACREVQVNDVIGMAYRNADAKIVFDQDDPMGASTCVACGECVQACPTGALMFKSEHDMRAEGTWDESAQTVTNTICPYCGVGCSLDLVVQDDEVVKVMSPLDSSVTEGHLCIKGRFGFQFVNERPDRRE